LLDWTHNPIYAAFFAAQSDSTMTGDICVWALDTEKVLGMAAPSCRLTVQAAPRSKIGFLHAQEGLFSSIRDADKWYALQGRWPNVEEMAPDGSLRQLLLAASQVPELRRLLLAEGVTLAHLMPTHDNVTKTLQDIWTLAAQHSKASE
jgi:hypothetical protein